MIHAQRHERGFALPTVVITAVILMTLLVGGLSTVTSVRRGMNEQYYLSLAREAAESGVQYAKSCVDKNLTSNASTGWGYDATVLETGDLCSGSFPGGVNCTSSPTATPNQCYVYYDATSKPQLRSKFSVAALTITGANIYTISVTGTVSLYTSAGTISKTYTQTQFIRAATDTRYGIATGNDTVCSIQAGKLYCWGKNDYGEVGIGTKPADVLVPTLIRGGLAGKYVQGVATGIAHTCAIAGDTPAVASMNKIYCWGANNSASRQYGESMTEVYAPPTTPQITLSSHYATAISARDHTCILSPTNDNSAQHVYCWGENVNQQAGEDDAGGHPDPKPNSGWLALRDTSAVTLTSVKQIMSVSGGNTCGINDTTNRYVFCAGNGDYGMLGNGTTTDSDRANWVQMYGSTTRLDNGIKVVTNNGHACAVSLRDSATTIDTAGHVWCWGSNWDYASSTDDWRVDSGPKWYGLNEQTRALRLFLYLASPAVGARTCVYDSAVGASGSYDCATITAAGRTATQLYSANVTDIAMSDWNICVVVQGIVYCSGYNSEGQLGQGYVSGPARGNATTATVAQLVKAEQARPVFGALKGKSVVSVVGGNNHFCAITSEHIVYCWGYNSNGQIGDGTYNNALSPVRAYMPHDVIY
ncbi:MAG: hypothetical protein ABIP74_04075 [Candidatus Saccharimonas sp.]